jgi:hypothetical protein
VLAKKIEPLGYTCKLATARLAVPSLVVALVTALTAAAIEPKSIEWLLVNGAPADDTKVTGKV